MMRERQKEIDPIEARAQEVKRELDAVSPSFCVAKWKQVTIHIQSGLTHSCHHPGAHKIPLEELINPSALHNTVFKKEQRKLMLEGTRPDECGYCWKVEDSNSNSLSDRYYKSADSWARPHLKEVAALPWDSDVNPSYVEVSFSNVCNFKCSYCAPAFSSKWMEEIEHHGAYPTTTKFNNLEWPTSQNTMPIPNREHNPYVEAFWKWWPDLYPSLKHFRITGGEPLMSRNTFKVMDYIIENPRPDLEFSINTNMVVPKPLMDRCLENLKRITGDGLVKKMRIYTSAEAHGAKAEYIRNGLVYNEWLDNINRFLELCPDLEFTIMSTFNALSVTSYNDFLKDFMSIRQNHLRRNETHSPILIDVPYLRYPEHQAAYILTNDYLDVAANIRDTAKKNIVSYTDGSDVMQYPWLHAHEATKIERVYNVMKSEMTDDVTRNSTQRADFYRFFSEHDRRRGTNFLTVFPEMEDFYNLCKELARD